MLTETLQIVAVIIGGCLAAGVYISLTGLWFYAMYYLIKFWASPTQVADFKPRKDSDPPQTNGGQACDMRTGPCSCGAWHTDDK